jgi:alkanesulfonate monooxygenase SsuD/methylene tetrahydromethanopterin reductase-like flavin-dependent oxidoreductase (luciferase family)
LDAACDNAQNSISRHYDAGINPLPVQRPIPLWFGGGSNAPSNLARSAVDKVLNRIARLGDGWMPPFSPGNEAQEAIAKFRDLCRKYDRDPATVGIEGIVRAYRSIDDKWAEHFGFWQKMGVSHIAFNPVNDGLFGVDAHLRRLEEVRYILPPNLLD